MDGLLIREIILYAVISITVALGIIVISLFAGYFGAKKGGHNTSTVTKCITAFLPAFAVFIVLSVVICAAFSVYKERTARQQAGIEYEQAGDYYMAYWSYRELQEDIGFEWSDLDECIERVREPGLYATAGVFEDAQEWIDAITTYQQIPNYLDSQERIDVCMYRYLLDKHPDWILGGIIQ